MSSTQIYTKLADLPATAGSFLDASSKGNFFFSLPWYSNFERHILTSDGLLRAYSLNTGGRNGDLSAFLPMRTAVIGNFGTRKLESLANYYSSLFGPSIDANSIDLESACAGLAKAIANDRPRWDQVALSPMAQNEPTFDAMKNGLENAGFKTEPYFSFGNWYMKTQGRSFDEYFSSLPSQLKNTIGRKRKQLETAKRGQFSIVTSTEGLDAAIEAYEKIYGSSWKIPEPYPHFIRGLIQTCASQGWLRVGVAHVDGEPAAAQIWIVYQGIANIYKLAYDERFSKTSVGSILTTQLMRHVMDIDKVHEVDYLTGDDAYKRDWMSHRRERWGIMAYNTRTPRGLALAGANAMRVLAKRVMDRPKKAVTE